MTNSALHLGLLFNSVRDYRISEEKRIRKLFAATNAISRRLRRACKQQRTWRTIMNRQLFPVLANESHLWCFDKKS